MRERYLWILVALLCGAAVFPPDGARANGGVHRTIVFRASFPFGNNGQAHGVMTCDVAPVLYRVTTLQGKYRVLQITVRSEGLPLAMSRTGDRLVLLYGEDHPREVRAVLDLAAREPQLWSKLPLEVRTDLAYPTGVRAGEEETVFAFVPLNAPPAPPDVMRFSLAGVPGGTIELSPPRATAD